MKKQKKISLLPIFRIILYVIFILSILPNNAYSTSLENYKLMKKVASLEDEGFQRLRFSLDLQQEVLTGGQPKFILIDTLGNRWLFKEQTKMISEKEVIIYEFAKLCGIDLPEIHQISLSVNGQIVQGTIQKYNSKVIMLKNFPPKRLNNKSIIALQYYQVFDWLLFNFDNTENHFLLEPRVNNLITIDKDRVFEVVSKDTPLSDTYLFGGRDNSYYCRLWDAVKKGDVTIDPSVPFDFINYLMSIDDSIVKEIFLDLANNPSTFLKDNLVPLLNRKKTLFQDFSSFYQHLTARANLKPLKVSINAASSEKWDRFVSDKLEKEFSLEQLKAGKYTKQLDLQQQGNIDIIYSREAWKWVWSKVFLDRTSNMSETKKYLDSLLNKTQNKYERLAINLYLARLKVVADLQDTKNRLWMENSVSIHPNFDYLVRDEIGQLKAMDLSISNKEHALKDLSPESYDFLLLGKKIAQRSNKTDINYRLWSLFYLPEQWRGYALEGFLDKALDLGYLDIVFFDNLMKKSLSNNERAAVSVYLGRYLYRVDNKCDLEFFKKYSYELRADWDSFCYGLGIEAGVDFFREQKKFEKLRDQFEKSMNLHFYPGFGYGIALGCGASGSVVKNKINKIPTYLHPFCYMGWGRNLILAENFDFDRAIKRIKSEKIFMYSKHFAFRGLGLGIAYWYFRQIERGARLLNKIDDSDFKFDSFFGMQDFIYHHQSERETYDPRVVGGIISKESHMERH